MSMFRAFLVVAVAFLCGGLTGCIYDDVEPAYSLAPGELLPDVCVELLDGEVFDTKDIHASGVENLIIVFFNTDCADCRRDLPQIQSLYDEILRDDNLSRNTRLVCIARAENASRIKDYWDAHGFTLPVSPQPDRRIYNLFASTGIPRVYLASAATGTIVAAWSPESISKASILAALREVR